MASLPSLFPYAARPGQADLVAFLQRAAHDGRHAVVESGTGTGKTVSALTAALVSARATGRRVLYLTRTNSQARQVMLEVRAIAAKSQDRRLSLALQGRQHLCPLRATDPEMAAADSEELALLCKDRMKAAEDLVASSGAITGE